MTLVYCPTCGTVVEKDTLEKAENVAQTHNEKRHDGTEVAEADPDKIDTSDMTQEQIRRFAGQYMAVKRENDE